MGTTGQGRIFIVSRFSLQCPDHIQAISWNLHFSNLKEDEEYSRKKGTPDYDKLFKIKSLYADIVSACKTYFYPKWQLAVDEHMVASKARIGLNQYKMDKSTKWGYKLFVLADSVCRYTWNLYVYEGKSSTEADNGLSYESVMQILDFTILEGLSGVYGYILYQPDPLL